MKLNHKSFKPKAYAKPTAATCPVDPSGEHKWASEEAQGLTKDFCVMCGHHE